MICFEFVTTLNVSFLYSSFLHFLATTNSVSAETDFCIRVNLLHIAEVSLQLKNFLSLKSHPRGWVSSVELVHADEYSVWTEYALLHILPISSFSVQFWTLKTIFKLNFLTFVKYTHTLFELHKFTFPKDPFIKRGVSGVNTLRIFPGTSLDLRTLNLKRAFFKVFAL